MAILAICTICISCAIPTVYRVTNGGENGEFRCLSPKKRMIIYKAFDTCPTTSIRPMAYDKHWGVVKFTEDNYNQYKLDLQFRNKVLSGVKSCVVPTTVTLRYLLDHGEHLTIDRFVERSDSISSKRLFLYGYWDNSQFQDKQSWVLDIRGNAHLKSKERIYSLFAQCRN